MSDVWLAAGVRTPFAKVDGALAGVDAIALSVPVARHMIGLLDGRLPDFARRPARHRQHLHRRRPGRRCAAGDLVRS